MSALVYTSTTNIYKFYLMKSGTDHIRDIHPPKPMMHIAYSPLISAKFIQSPILISFFIFLASPTLTMMLNMYWTPLDHIKHHIITW